jgi:transcriptional regulator with XRE-family HTH domain
MTDPEDPTAKNEQELNLFSDQPVTGETPAEPESGEPAANGEIPVENNTAVQDIPASEPSEQPVPETSVPPDDSPVVAPPPPPRKQPSPARPGIVSPRAGRATFPQPSSAPASSVQHKPLPHALQPDQTLGQMLTAIRNARGMSPEEVAAHTRIRLEYITELESGELLENLPPVYVSAYVRKLIEVYDLPKADSDVLLDKLREETPQDPEELSDKLLESVNEGALVNEGENKRIRNITIGIFVVLGIVAAALIWLIVLVIVKYVRTSEPVPAHDPAAATSTVQPAEEPVSQAVHLDESELDALIVPETPSISVLKMSKVPGVRESL